MVKSKMDSQEHHPDFNHGDLLANFAVILYCGMQFKKIFCDPNPIIYNGLNCYDS